MKNVSCVAIIGVGLIGGSIGLALRKRGLAERVIGFGSRPETLASALRMGAITQVAAELNEAVSQADLVVVCAPVDHIVESVRQIAHRCPPGTLITDAGSTKAAIVRQLEQAAATDAWQADVRFIGSHPLAGNDKKGPLHATADLFAGRTVVVTPVDDSPAADLKRTEQFWSSLGATVVQMSPEAHDEALAATSHLPHLLAAAIAGATPERFVALTAGGWQDTTRIAGGDPALWRQIMLANRTNLLDSLENFKRLLDRWQTALEESDAVELERLLAEAKRIRDAVGS